MSQRKAFWFLGSWTWLNISRKKKACGDAIGPTMTDGLLKMVRTGGWFMNGLSTKIETIYIYSITYHYENSRVLPHEWTNKIEVWLLWREQCREFDTKKTRHYNPRRLGFLTHPAIFETPNFGSSSKAPRGNSSHGLPGDPYPATGSCRRSGSTRWSRTESRWSHWISCRWHWWAHFRWAAAVRSPPSPRPRSKSPSDLVRMDRSWWVPQFKTDRDHFEAGWPSIKIRPFYELCKDKPRKGMCLNIGGPPLFSANMLDPFG